MLLKPHVPLAVLGCVATTLTVDPQYRPADDPKQAAVVWNFDDDDALPQGFTFSAMRRPAPVPFVIRSDAGNRFLHHVAEVGGRGYSMAIAPGEPMSDMVVSVRIRLDGGGREAGIVSRYHDERNYYVTRLDLGRAELRMWRVFNGNHDRIEFQDDLQLDANAWHSLKVVHRGDWVLGYLAGIRVFEDHDSRNRVFPPGRSGVMVNADSSASFDDLRIGR